MMRRSDICAGLGLAAAALATLLWLIPSQTSPAQSEGNMSPAMMPTVAVALVLALALLLAVTRHASTPSMRDEPHEEFGTEARGFGRQELLELALWTATSVAVMALLRYAGFIAAGGVVLTGAMLFMGQRNPWTIAAAALGAPLSIWLIAWYGFSVQMP